jgi:hypothetical protein
MFLEKEFKFFSKLKAVACCNLPFLLNLTKSLGGTEREKT